MNRLKSGSFITLLVLVFLGLIMVIYPRQSLDFMIKITGVGLLLVGIGGIISALLQRNMTPSGIASFIGCICSVVIGFICLFRPGFVQSIFHFFMGIIIAYHGIVNLLSAVDMRKGEHNWQAPLILSIVSIIVGVLIFAGTFSPLSLLVRVIGIAVMFSAGVGLWMMAVK